MAGEPPPPRPDPPAERRSRVAIYLVAAIVSIVVASVVGGLYIFNAFTSRATCTVANAAAVRLVEQGEEKNFETAGLGDVYLYGPVKMTYPNGSTIRGSLLAAQTTIGVAVWALDENSAQRGSGSIAAVNEAAVTVANWGSSAATDVDASDVRAAEACAGLPSGNV